MTGLSNSPVYAKDMRMPGCQVSVFTCVKLF